MLRGIPSEALLDSSISTGYGSITAPRVVGVDFRQANFYQLDLNNFMMIYLLTFKRSS